MKKIQFETNIGLGSLYELITCHLTHGFNYTMVSNETFELVKTSDPSLSPIGIPFKKTDNDYVWYSFDNLIYLLPDDQLKENEMIYFKEEDLELIIRDRKIKRLTNRS